LQPTLYALRRLTLAVLGPVGVVMAAVAAAALGAGILQTGGISSSGAIGFKPDRINPVAISRTCSRCAPRRGWRNR
jgi:type III secretory pathway component EscU